MLGYVRTRTQGFKVGGTKNSYNFWAVVDVYINITKVEDSRGVAFVIRTMLTHILKIARQCQRYITFNSTRTIVELLPTEDNLAVDTKHQRDYELVCSTSPTRRSKRTGSFRVPTLEVGNPRSVFSNFCVFYFCHQPTKFSLSSLL